MYVRDARNRDEAWLLDHIEELGLDEASFRSRDYVIAVDEDTNEKAGFGRIRIHKLGDEEYCEFTSLGILDDWRGQGVGAHVIERLVENADAQGFPELYAFFDSPEYLEQFGFREITASDLPEGLDDRLDRKRQDVAPNAAPMRLDLDRFEVPDHLREAFKLAGAEESDDEPEESPEDFGIDPDSATYKYDTGR